MILFIFSDKPFASNTTYIPFKDLFISLKYIMPAKGINYDKYYIITKAIQYIFAGLFVWLLAQKVHDLFITKRIIITHKKLLFITLLLLILIFLVPDYIGASTGFISSRLMHFFFIFLIIWLATQHVPIWIKTMVFSVTIIVNILVINHNYKS